MLETGIWGARITNAIALWQEGTSEGRQGELRPLGVGLRPWGEKRDRRHPLSAVGLPEEGSCLYLRAVMTATEGSMR